MCESGKVCVCVGLFVWCTCVCVSNRSVYVSRRSPVHRRPSLAPCPLHSNSFMAALVLQRGLASLSSSLLLLVPFQRLLAPREPVREETRSLDSLETEKGEGKARVISMEAISASMWATVN